VNAAVRNALALPGYHQLSLIAQPTGVPQSTLMNQIQHTSQSGVPASIEIGTLVNLTTGSLLWLEYSAGNGSAAIHSRIAIHCVRVMP
jgi:hypothetical protein